MASFNAEVAVRAIEKQLASLQRSVESGQKSIDELSRSLDSVKKAVETSQRALEAQDKIVKVLVETRGAKKEEAVGKLREQVLTAEDRKVLADMRATGEDVAKHRASLLAVERELKDLKDQHHRMGRLFSDIDIVAVQAKADREMKALQQKLERAEAASKELASKQSDTMRLAHDMAGRLERTQLEKVVKEVVEQSRVPPAVEAGLKQLEVRLRVLESRR